MYAGRIVEHTRREVGPGQIGLASPQDAPA
jgi:hypothetical protein